MATVDKSITMNLDQILELDYLVEEITDNAVKIKSDPTGNLSKNYVTKNKFVFDPPQAETYQLEINNQIIEIEVIDIPANGDYQWYVDEASGTTLMADVGDVNMTVSTDTAWISDSNSVKGEHLEFNTGDRATTDTRLTHDSLTVFGWHRPSETSGTLFEVGSYASTESLALEATPNGWEILTADGGGTSNLEIADYGTITTGNWYFFGVSFDDSDGSIRLLVWDTSQNLIDTTSSTSLFNTGSQTLSIGSPSGGGRDTNPGDYDFYGYAENRTLSKTDLEELWNTTNNR